MVIVSIDASWRRWVLSCHLSGSSSCVGEVEGLREGSGNEGSRTRE